MHNDIDGLVSKNALAARNTGGKNNSAKQGVETKRIKGPLKRK